MKSSIPKYYKNDTRLTGYIKLFKMQNDNILRFKIQSISIIQDAKYI